MSSFANVESYRLFFSAIRGQYANNICIYYANMHIAYLGNMFPQK